MTVRAQRDRTLEEERRAGRTAARLDGAGETWRPGRPLSAGGLLHLQRTAGNGAVSRLVRGQSAPTVQRWPITSGPRTTYDYSIGQQFMDKHVAADLDSAERKAWRRYDPEDPHNTAVTVVVERSLRAVRRGDDARVLHPYHWALSIAVEGVMIAPRGIVGAGGDPGQAEDVDEVVISGYNVRNRAGAVVGGLITHVSASQ